jgi:hypothetical protein
MKRNSYGSALILVMTLATVLLLVALATSTASVSDVNLTIDEKLKAELELACESGLNRAKAKLHEAYTTDNLTLEPDISFQGTSTDDTGTSPDERVFSFSDTDLADEEFVSGTYMDYYQYTETTDSGKSIIVRYGIKEEQDWQRKPEYTIETVNVEASAYADGYGWVGMREKAFIRRSTLFMYSIFFEDELEVLPGANHEITGLIHTNKDMYLGTHANLKVYTDGMTAAGEIYNRRYNSTENMGGSVSITRGNKEGSLQSMTSDNLDSDYYVDETDNWVTKATQRWQGSVKDSNLGAKKLKAPNLQSIEPGGYYDQNSTMKINVLTQGRSAPAYEITYKGVTYAPVEATEDEDTGKYTAFNGALTETEFWDNRESASTGQKVKTTDLDISKINNIISTSGDQLENLDDDGVLVYLTRDDAVADNDGNPYTPDPGRNVTGFKFTNGDQLPAPMTFVSNLPVYVQGDFNKHTSETPSLDDWRPAAVVSDSISVLSNSWQDSENQSPNLKNASNTEFNLVFVTGNVPTNPNSGQYSGGFENFPRMCENWSNKTLSIKGGFIQLFRSQFATGNWVYGGNNYTAPGLRNWAAEPRFQNLNDLPPTFTDLFPSVDQGIIYTNWKLISNQESNLVESQ